MMKLKNPNISTTKGMISKWENEKEEPSRFRDVATIAEVFGVTADWLIGLTNEKEKKTTFKRIPILRNIAAGIPILAQEDIEGYEQVLSNQRIDFCLRVKGDIMINSRILDGDLVYIRQQSDVETGEIAAVLINNETATLKRVYKLNGTIVLRSENPSYSDQIYSKEDMKEVRILGKAIQFKSEVI
ncbi:LexA repressor [Desulfosporosinus acididurans]|uniref:LexA repressor n=2 Tax=Desulfosporosinus acididurans TaxID=476652 RepID=A0A0J1IHB7_9FIRM|nr:LexA repressor [Desulfosporosinus acididurans]